MNTVYRIHGDNIIECEVATSIILEAIKFATGNDYTVGLIDSNGVTPAFSAQFEGGLTFVLEFFPGHNRWDTSLPDFLAELGAPLKESVDAFVTKVVGNTEESIAAFEFCNALPAGNNAWQRAGRALAMTMADIPYFYFAEIGGQELDANREIKAPRFPNPIVPFSYLANSSAAPDKCTTVYMASRSISQKTYKEFEEVFANNEYKRAISSLFTGDPVSEASLDSSKKKSAKFIYDLAQRRKRGNTHSLEMWTQILAEAEAGHPIASHLIRDGLSWSKKISIPSNPSLKLLVGLLKKVGVSAIGSTEMPFCILPQAKRREIADELKAIYTESLSDEFLEWLANGEKDLVFVLVAGFKPRGDDSRPDRGLVPMARMIFANDDVDILSIIYGPAKPTTWQRLFTDPYRLASTNGLWEAVVSLSNALIVDSVSLEDQPRRDVIVKRPVYEITKGGLKKFSNVPRYGEHDVDSVLHLIFSDSEDKGVFESLCNPPGGDWSGISFLDDDGATNRWTSLPRVTGLDGKRPDHIIQFFKNNRIILSVESKDLLRNLEDKVGPRLDRYTKELLQTGAAQSRKLKKSLEWSQEVNIPLLKEAITKYDYMSAVAVMGDKQQAIGALEKSKADIAISIKFASDGSTELFYISNNEKLLATITDFFDSQSGKLDKLKTKLRQIS
ncbi:MAG TPA: hypothetical protein VF733_06010 [Candidatus Saccharimonadales bacterium]